MAKISPEGFPTTYRLEYGTTESYGQSTPDAEVGSNAQPHTVSDLLEGLQAGTVYHYRFVAESALGTAEGDDHVFHTYAHFVAETECPNQSYRSGSSANLPDCRAYEMVSPVDKEGGEIRVLGDFTTGLPAVMSQSSTDGGKLAYGSYQSFGGAESALYTTQYIAARQGPEEAEPGWSSAPISPPLSTLTPGSSVGDTFRSWFKLFSADLCEAWLSTHSEPTLAPEAISGYPNLYKRRNCATPAGYEALTTAQPPEGTVAELLGPELLGVSADGAEAIYIAFAKLTKDAPGITEEFYEKSPQGLKYLCILPGGLPAKACTGGGPWRPIGSIPQMGTRVDHAISADGTRIFWTAGDKAIYLRENPFGEGGECSGEGSPCTLAVSRKGEELSGTEGFGAQFWGAAKDGSKAIFTVTEGTIADLYEFDVGSNSVSKIAGKVAGVAGMSEDAARIYFVSKEDLDGAGPAAAGQQNLYLRDGGQGGENLRFVGTLSSADPDDSSGFSPVGSEPWLHATRVSPDGRSLAFMSYGSPTGYDNTDRSSGEADAEVYLYDATADGGEGRLLCVSCNPSGARPAGQGFKRFIARSGVPTAGMIPVPENNLHEARVLSADGRRLFFEAYDPLSLSDTNGARDVYQWEAPGEGRCSTASPTYSPLNGGCVDLISSGKSKIDSEFTEADAEGENVFFTTLSSLVPWDPGVLDVYDARIEGGLPGPKVPAGACEGEACQSAPEAPNDPTPASSSFEGAGNVHEEAPAARKACAKGKVKRHGRCVAKKHARKRRAKRNGRAGR
jgi:hypothetical protein